MIMGGEENLLGKYIEMGRNFDWTANYDVIMVDDTIWPKIETMPQYVEKKKMDAISRGWDSIIDRAHEGSSRYERVARQLARPDRYMRRILANTFYDAYATFMKSGAELFRRKMPLQDTTYCFLITDEITHPSRRSQHMLRAMCVVARGLDQQNSRILGVGTNKGNTGYDFYFLDMPEWTAEDEALKIRVQKKYGIFESPRVTEQADDEYPPLEVNG